MKNKPLAAFITFSTYGMWLHGDKRGSIIRTKGTTKLIKSAASLENYHKAKLKQRPFKLDTRQRKAVFEAVKEHCQFKDWQLIALHVRSNHDHILVCADGQRIIADFKSWATRKLKQNCFVPPKIWAQGGSKQYIFTQDKLREKADYRVNQQGSKMDYYIADGF